jgi:hypothetical protein
MRRLPRSSWVRGIGRDVPKMVLPFLMLFKEGTGKRAPARFTANDVVAMRTSAVRAYFPL